MHLCACVLFGRTATGVGAKGLHLTRVDWLLTCQRLGQSITDLTTFVFGLLNFYWRKNMGCVKLCVHVQTWAHKHVCQPAQTQAHSHSPANWGWQLHGVWLGCRCSQPDSCTAKHLLCAHTQFHLQCNFWYDVQVFSTAHAACFDRVSYKCM